MIEVKSQKCRLGKKLRSFDKFGQHFNLKLDQGQDTLPSKMGAFFTIMLGVILLGFTYYKYDIMQTRKDVDILSAIKTDHFGPDYKFGFEQGLNVAVAVFNPFDPSSFQHLDHTYGRVRF